jgi:hypothetical protein
VGLCFNLFSELDDGLELGVVLLSLFVVYVMGMGGAGSEGYEDRGDHQISMIWRVR